MRRTALSLLALVGLIIASVAGPPASALQSVSSVKQISRDNLACPSFDRTSDDTACQLDTEPELDIQVNPTNSNNLVGVFQMGRYSNGGAVDIGWSTSFDGGKTWPYKGAAPGLTIGVSSQEADESGAPYERASDPVVAFDRKHKRVYLNGIAVSVKGCAVYCTSALTVNISKDGGKTFGKPVIVHENTGNPDDATGMWTFNDKNWITTDNNPNSPHYGRTYVVWDQVHCTDANCTTPAFQPAVLRYSDNGGTTWSDLIQATTSEVGPTFQEIGVQPVTLPNGHVVIVYADVQAGVYTFFGSFKAIRSTNGGQTWSAPTTAASALAYSEESNALRAPNVPSVVARGNKIYVAFHHVPAGAQNPDVNPSPNDVFLTTSSDEGQTWTTPVDVTPESGLDHFTPDIAVAGGIVHLTYMAHAMLNVDADPNVSAVYRQVVNFVPGSPVTLKTSIADFAACTTTALCALKFFGDYTGITAAACIAHPIWAQSQEFTNQTDNDTNTHSRAFSARIRYCRTAEGGEGDGDRD